MATKIHTLGGYIHEYQKSILNHDEQIFIKLIVSRPQIDHTVKLGIHDKYSWPKMLQTTHNSWPKL